MNRSLNDRFRLHPGANLNLSLEPAPPALKALMMQVYLNYATLMGIAAGGGQPHVGGKLLYVGELDARATTLAIAANIAGAASLAATATQAASRQAMREGVVDFVVTALDEALRILKNQVRKREPVSVCVGTAPEDIEHEMLERGVAPDLVSTGNDMVRSSLAEIAVRAAQKIQVQPLAAGQTLFTVEIPVALTRETARIEEILAGSIPEDDIVNHRWLRLSPRYLGSTARRVRSVVCDSRLASKLREKLS